MAIGLLFMMCFVLPLVRLKKCWSRSLKKEEKIDFADLKKEEKNRTSRINAIKFVS